MLQPIRKYQYKIGISGKSGLQTGTDMPVALIRCSLTDGLVRQMGVQMSDLQLVDLVERAREYKMKPGERREQRVSLIMGLRGANSTLTREKVREVLDDTEGCEDHNPK